MSLLGIASPSLLNHGGVGLDHIGGHARAPTKPCESGVYDGGRARDLPRAQGSRIPCVSGGICRGLRGVLRAWVQCAIAPISLLSATVLWFGTPPLDPLWNLVYSSLCDPM
jgi:hypothetical protein